MPQVIRSLSARPYLLFIAAFITVTALLLGTNQSFSASSLKLISPNGGQSYAVGQSVNIKWAKGNGGSQVKVSLLKGGKGYLVITKKTANDGKLTWKIPSKVKAGSNYKIKIQSLSDTKVSDTSNKPFKITKAKSTKAKDTKTATFKVTQPKRGKKYKTGKKMAIRWVKGTGTYVKITLLKGKTTTTIHKKTKNDGKHTYTIPSTIKAGKTYKVKICSTKSTKSCATSKAFTISKGTASSTVKVTFPNKKEELEQGSTHVIKWTKGNGGKFVKIQLTRVVKGKDKGFRTLAGKTKNDGVFSWKVPSTKGYPVGSKYKIKVMAIGKTGKTINDLSDKTFSIIKASGGGSRGGGSTGGGNEGGGNAGGGNEGGGKEGDGQGNDGVGAILTVTSPTGTKTYVARETVVLKWKVTGTVPKGANTDAGCFVIYKPDGTVEGLALGSRDAKQGTKWVVFGSDETGTWGFDIWVKRPGDGCDGVPLAKASGNFVVGKIPVKKPAEPPKAKKKSCKWSDLRIGAVLGERHVKEQYYTGSGAYWAEDGTDTTYRSFLGITYADKKLCGAGAAAQSLPVHTRTCSDGTWSPPPTLNCPPAVCGDGSDKGNALCDEVQSECVDKLRTAHHNAWRACTDTMMSCKSSCYDITGGSHIDLGMSVVDWIKLPTYPAYNTCRMSCVNTGLGCMNNIKFNIKQAFNPFVFAEDAAKAACSR